MLDEIIKLIDEKKYPAAIKEADAEFERLIFTNRLDTDHETCEKVLAWRVVANTLAGYTDDLVYHNIWKLRFPHKESVELFPGRQVHLLDMNVLLFKCDAWINIFHENKDFDYAERSFSHTLTHRVPKEEIANAINSQKDFIKRGFLVLEHQGLITKRSYHIPAVVTNENEIDLTRLSFGLKAVLNYSKDMKHKIVGIPAIGMATNPKLEKKKEIISCVAETIKEFFIENRKKEIPEIYFPFVNINSFLLFKEIFYSYSRHGQYLTNINKKLTETQQRLIDVSRSKNPKFIKRLERLAYEINEDSTILILGETGVGKSYIAEEIHKLSNRELIKFRALNCGSIIPENLHTEIFGFDPKAFSFVRGKGESIFEVCDNGTVFLDEISNANLFVQQSLLTFLDKKEYKKGGMFEIFKADVRIIFGTNKNLEEQVSKGLFLQDLYERISNQRVLKIPPLRERTEDIKSFIEWKCKDLNTKENLDIKIAPDAIEYLLTKTWPGNIRQLENYFQRKYFDAKYDGLSELTKSSFELDPPRNYRLDEADKYSSLEIILKEIIEKWDYKKYGKFKDELLEPMISKIYLYDLKSKFNKSDANQILGIAGDRKDSKVEQNVVRYDEIMKKLH